MTATDTQQCAKCEYDLTGLPPIGACPECGNFFNTVTREGISQSHLYRDGYRGKFFLIFGSTIFLFIAFISTLLCAGICAGFFKVAFGIDFYFIFESGRFWMGLFVVACLLVVGVLYKTRPARLANAAELAQPAENKPAGSRCEKCNYNLARLPESGNCPICATPYDRSAPAAAPPEPPPS